MQKFQLITDGSCDLRPEFAKENNIEVVPFYISYDKTSHLREGVDILVDDFYQDLLKDPKLFPLTSAPNTGDYLKVFTKYAKENVPMICLCITQKFSGSFSFANLAKAQVLEDYPNANIVVIDTIINTVLQGQLVKEVMKMRDAGYTLEEAASKTDEIKHEAKILFTTEGLDYLKNGGRIGKASALIGTLLNINPIIILTKGEIFSKAKATSRKRAIAKLKTIIEEEFADKNPNDYSLVVGYCFQLEEIEDFRRSIASMLNVEEDFICIEKIGATIGVHVGPYAMGIGYVKKYDV